MNTHTQQSSNGLPHIEALMHTVREQRKLRTYPKAIVLRQIENASHYLRIMIEGIKQQYPDAHDLCEHLQARIPQATKLAIKEVDNRMNI